MWVALTTFVGSQDGWMSAVGRPVPDGAAKKDKLLVLVADMEAKPPAGHEQDFAVYNQLYDMWADLLAAPSADKAKQLQAMARGADIKQAQAHLRNDILTACPALKNVGL
jgi:hypothetical protein